METIAVVCDVCGADLTATGNCVDYRITLRSERIPSAGGTVTAMMVYRPIEKPLHFCGWDCLTKWAEKTWSFVAAPPVPPARQQL